MNAATDVRVVSLPGKDSPVPYIKLFYRSLERHGVRNVGELYPTSSWLQREQSSVDVLHIHWPEKVWRRDYVYESSRIKSIRGYFLFRKLTRHIRSRIGFFMYRRFLQTARKLGKPVVWTLHELVPHTQASPIDYHGYALLAERSDVIISHSLACKDAFVSRYGNVNKIVYMPHGNFRGEYPAPRRRNVVLSECRLRPDLPVFCLLGALRGYKGVSLALETALAGSERIQLIVAGGPLSGFPTAEVETKCASMGNVCFIPRVLTEQEFSDLGSACDAFLLPYDQITTSGVMNAALTLGRGVICSNLPYFTESLQEFPDCGRIAIENTAEEFLVAISEYLNIPPMERGAAAGKFSDSREWSKVIVPVAESLRSLARC
jgi:beta-1,4-mannosyltransferase